MARKNQYMKLFDEFERDAEDLISDIRDEATAEENDLDDDERESLQKFADGIQDALDNFDPII